MSTSDTTSQSATGRRKVSAAKAAQPGASAPAKKRVRRTASSMEQQQMPTRQVEAEAVPADHADSQREPAQDREAIQWQRLVAEAAYFRAERRGFAGGSAEQDWYEAEDELRRLTKETRI